MHGGRGRRGMVVGDAEGAASVVSVNRFLSVVVRANMGLCANV